MNISILCSDENHPVNPWLKNWMVLNEHEHDIKLLRKADEMEEGDILFLISCHEILTKRHRNNFRHCLILHASSLPEGRGMSPHIWQILEGKKELTLTLLSAEDKLDSGHIWAQFPIQLDGTELFDEINEKIFKAEIQAMSWTVKNIDSASPHPQSGVSTYFRRRTPSDSKLDPNKTIAEQFNLLRVSDPNRYPAFFEINGCKYKIFLERYDEYKK